MFEVNYSSDHSCYKGDILGDLNCSLLSYGKDQTTKTMYASYNADIWALKCRIGGEEIRMDENTDNAGQYNVV